MIKHFFSCYFASLRKILDLIQLLIMDRERFMEIVSEYTDIAKGGLSIIYAGIACIIVFVTVINILKYPIYWIDENYYRIDYEELKNTNFLNVGSVIGKFFKIIFFLSILFPIITNTAFYIKCFDKHLWSAILHSLVANILWILLIIIIGVLLFLISSVLFCLVPVGILLLLIGKQDTAVELGLKMATFVTGIYLMISVFLSSYIMFQDYVIRDNEEIVETMDSVTEITAAKYRKEVITPVFVETSSYYKSAKTGVVYDGDLTIDNNISTCWQDGIGGSDEEGDGIGETLVYRFADKILLGEIDICNGNRSKTSSYGQNNRLAEIIVHYYVGEDEVHQETMSLSDDQEIEYEKYEILDGILCDGVVIEINKVYSGTIFHDTCMSEIRFYQLLKE